MEKVIATEAASQLIQQLQAKHGELIFVHSEGCCDGTSPICMTEGDFYLGSRDEANRRSDGCALLYAHLKLFLLAAFANRH